MLENIHEGHMSSDLCPFTLDSQGNMDRLKDLEFDSTIQIPVGISSVFMQFDVLLKHQCFHMLTAPI